MPETIVVSPDPARLSLKPGEKATTTVAIRNRSEEVEHYQLVVEGVPTGWAEIVPDQASAFPFQETNAQLNLHPPQGAVGATYHVLVRAVSQERAGMEGRGTVELEVPQVAPVAAPPPQTVAPTQPVAEAPRTQAASQIQVKVEPAKDGALPPPAAQWRLLCKNAGGVLDTFSFGISGLRPNWLSIEPAELTLKPGEEATAVLTIRPPQGTNAGVYAFVVRTFSHLNVNQRTEVPLKIEVRPSAGFRVGIFPKDAEAQGPREFKVSLTGDQASNCDLNLDLAATDQDNACDFVFDPVQVFLPARQTATSTARVSPRAVLGPNERKTYTFQVVATPREALAPAQTDTARLTQTGAVPPVLTLRPQVQTADQEAEYTLSIANPSTLETKLLLTAEDPEAGCDYVFRPSELTAPPGGEIQAKLKVRAHSFWEEEGNKTITFSVAATRSGELVAAAKTEGRLVQRRVRPIVLQLIPSQQSQPGHARFIVQAQNPRPTPALILLEAKDEADAVQFTFKPDQIALSPAAEGRATLQVWPKDHLMRGEQRRVHRFVVTGKTEGAAAPVKLDGVLAQTPGSEWLNWFGKWGLWLLKWAIFLALALFVLSLATVSIEEIASRNADLSNLLYSRFSPSVIRQMNNWIPFAPISRGIVDFIAAVIDILFKTNK